VPRDRNAGKDILRFLIRAGLSVFFGQFLLVVPMGIAWLFGMHGWGFMHSGWVLVAFPITIAAAYWLLRFVPGLRFDLAAPRNIPDENSNDPAV
jgi:hypothetical protein